MLHEFALDPKAICDRHAARYFFDACRPEKGRLVSQFPGNWKRLVYEHCRSVVREGTSLKYIEEKLRKMDGNLIKTGRDYDSSLEWVVNAVTSHGREPFRAIISPSPGPGVLHSDVDEDDTAWRTDGCITVYRRSKELACCCEGLLKHAKTVIFVDPYFDGARVQMKVLKALMKEAAKGSALTCLEYHVKERDYSGPEFEQLLLERVAPELPETGVPFYVIRWQDGSETLHDRYILTNLAGVNISQGLSECRANESDTTDISLLSQQTFERRRMQYSADNDGCFKLVDGWCLDQNGLASVTKRDGMWYKS